MGRRNSNGYSNFKIVFFIVWLWFHLYNINKLLCQLYSKGDDVKMKKIIFICLILNIIFCSCGYKKDNTSSSKAPIEENNESIAESQDQPPVTNSSILPEPPKLKTTNVEKSSSVLDDFVPFSDCFIETNINTEKISQKNNDPFSGIYSIKGSYDLDSDGTVDEISCLLFEDYVSDEKPHLKINNVSTNIHIDSTYNGEFKIVDIDKSDKYKEIAIFDGGCSDDPEYDFYRYDSGKIIRLGSVFDPVLADNKGRLVSRWNLIDFVTPSMLTGYEMLNGTEFITKKLDNKSSLGKEYKITNLNSPYFKEVSSFKDIPNDFSPSFTAEPEDNKPELKVGNTIKIIDIKYVVANNVPLWYCVELQNGQKGILYYRMGD